jgi:hypothetical protein
MNHIKKTLTHLKKTTVILSFILIFHPAKSLAQRSSFLDDVSKLETGDYTTPQSYEYNTDSRRLNTNKKNTEGKVEPIESKKISKQQNTQLLDKKNAELIAQITALKQQNTRLVESQKGAASALGTKNAELTAQITALKQQNTRLVESQKGAASVLDTKTAELTAQIAALKQQNTRLVESQKGAASVLGTKTAELIAQITALKQQNTRLVESQKGAASVLGTKNAELIAQIAALKQQNTRLVESQKGAASVLGTKNAELTAQIAALKQQNTRLVESQKGAASVLDTKNAELTEQITALKQQNTRLVESQKGAASMLDTKNAELTAQIAALKQQNTRLVESQRAKNEVLDKKNSNQALSYSLGVYFLQKALLDTDALEINGFRISKETLRLGFNDYFSNTLQMSKNEMEEKLLSVNNLMAKKKNETERVIENKLKNKKYEKLKDGTYLFVESNGKGKYNYGEKVFFNIFEKKIDGIPIMNTMNNSVFYDRQTDPVIRKVISSGSKGGRVTIYGKASIIYKSLPKSISGDDVVSITFALQ